jgi:hypothetical protein
VGSGGMKISLNSTTTSSTSTGGRIAGKGCGTLFFGVFFAMGVVFAVLVLGEGLRQAAPWRWVETPCTILSSAVEETDDEEKPYRPMVRYVYEVGDRSYEGNQLTRGSTATASYDRARDLAARYQTGASAICRVDPEHPAISVLERSLPWIFLAVLIPMIFVAVGAGGLWAIWRGSTSAAADGVRSISATATKGKGHRFVIGLGLLFAVVGGAVFTFLFAVPCVRTLATAGWEARPCTIERSTVRSWSTDDGTSYRADVLYTYSAHGRDWRSNRVSFFSALSTGRDDVSTTLDRYPAGAQLTAWVDRDDPSRSVLEREFRPRYLLGLLPLVFLFAGAALMRFGWKQLRAASESVARRPEKTLPDASPVTLKPQLSPFGKVIGTLVFALLWNGIVSVFVWQVWKGWQAGSPDLFLTIFITPFVLIGLAAFTFVGYFTLALANPRPRVTVQRGEPCLGDELRIDWRFTGRASRLAHLRIFLEGREEATYRRGTDTVTDREVFAAIDLVDTGNDWEIPRGKAAITIPDDTMHSFAAGNNKIVWEIKVAGEIQRWPDVDQNFPLTIHPLRLEDI